MIKGFYKLINILMPVLSTLLIILPLIELQDNNKNVMLVIIGIIAFISHFVSSTNMIIKQDHNNLSNEMLIGERDITQERYDLIYKSFKDTIIHNKKHQKLNYNPIEKIAFILNTINSCFEKYLHIHSKYISVAVFYRFDYFENDIWKRLDKNYFAAYENNEEVIFEPDSFGRYVMEGTQDFYFFYDKYKEGVKSQRYKLNEKDIETKNKFHKYGSIIGTKIVVRIREKEYIHALLTISTYGKKIGNIPLKIDRKKEEYKLENFILPMFVNNIESELIQLYLQEIDKK